MAYLSQRDPRWAGLQLGNSPYTIGTDGCLVTDLANYIGITPDVVVKRLMAVGGFTAEGWVIWAKVAEAFPGVFIAEPYVRAYNNDEVLANLPCLVEVDFDGNPRTNGKHWVIFRGNGELIDPLDGQVKPTSTYPAVLSYRAIKGAWAEAAQEHPDYYKGLDMANKDSMRVAIDAWAKLRDGELIDKINFENQLTATTTCQTQLRTAIEQANQHQAHAQASDELLIATKKELDDLKSKREEDQHTIIALKSELEAVHKEDKDYLIESVEAQEAKKDSDSILIKAADVLGVKYNASDKEGNQLILSAIREVVDYAKKLENAFTTQPITQDPRTVPTPPTAVQRKNIWNALFGWAFVN